MTNKLEIYLDFLNDWFSLNNAERLIMYVLTGVILISVTIIAALVVTEISFGESISRLIDSMPIYQGVMTVITFLTMWIMLAALFAGIVFSGSTLGKQMGADSEEVRSSVVSELDHNTVVMKNNDILKLHLNEEIDEKLQVGDRVEYTIQLDYSDTSNLLGVSDLSDDERTELLVDFNKLK